MAKFAERARRVRAYLRPKGPSAVQGAGLFTFAAGAFVLAPWLGLMFAGVFLCVIGWAIDQ